VARTFELIGGGGMIPIEGLIKTSTVSVILGLVA